MSLAPDALVTLGGQILDLVVAGFTAVGVTLPDARYLMPGIAPIWDGEQVTCQLVRVFQGHPGAEIGGYQRPPLAIHSAEWNLMILRSCPVLDGDFVWPSTGAETSSAVENWTDAATLTSVLEGLRDTNALTVPGEPFVIGTVAPVGTEGGLVGVAGTIAFGLDGMPGQ